MRHIRTTIAAMAASALPAPALATVYDFQSTETSALSPSPVSFAFSLNTSEAVFSAGATNFNNVSIDENGASIPGNTVGIPFDTNISSPLFFLVDTATTPFSSGTGPAITFNTGTFAIADGATDGEGHLTISSIPEPSTVSLMAAGLSMIGGMLFYRRRRERVASIARSQA